MMQTIKRWVRSIIRYPRHFKWWYQRARRGYSDCDAWNGDFFLARQISGILRWQVKNGHTFPSAYLPRTESFTDLEVKIAIEARDSEYLHYADIFDEYAKNGPALNKEWQKEFGGVLDKDIKDALQWFSEHFVELWD